MDKSYTIYIMFSALVFKVFQYSGQFNAVSLTNGRLKYICKFIFAASFTGRKKKLILNLKIYKYYLVMFWRIFFDSFWKNPTRCFYKISLVCHNCRKSWKTDFFLKSCWKSQKTIPFFVYFPLATKCTSTTTVILILLFSLSLQIEQESDCTYKNKICCTSIY